MYRYFLFTFLAVSLLVLPASAQNELIRRITPLTGTDRVKVIAEISHPVKLRDYTVKAVIRPLGTSPAPALWEGEVSPTLDEDRGVHYFRFQINGLAPELWTPASPFLYELTLELTHRDGKQIHASQRLGFRMFESRNGRIHLNGKPIFLRGIAINPPGRGIPTDIERSREFAEEYVRFMKSIHVNIIRIPDDETWYDVCDELGMMVFGGNYGSRVDGEKPPADYDKAVSWYKNEKFSLIAHHPSLMIYALTNEVPFTGEVAREWIRFLSYAHGKLREWDHTRLYIGNAGYGYGQSGDICDLHRYWGWYYASPFTFLHIRDNEQIIPFKKPVQPITFTECVGNYSGPDGRFNLSPDHKNPGSQLNWTGHAPTDQQALLANEHQNFTFKQATELFRRLRVINPELSGVFPFTILFLNWHTIEKFIDMDPKPVAEQARRSYQPVLLSWECWTPNVYAGSEIQPVAHVVNDDDHFRDLSHARLVVQLQDDSRAIVRSDTVELPRVPYYGTYEEKLRVRLPTNLSLGTYRLTGRIFRGEELVSENHIELFVGNDHLRNSAGKPEKEVLLYDPAGHTAASLRELAIPFRKITGITDLAPNQLVLIGENAVDEDLVKAAARLRYFVRNGGRVVYLRQDSTRWDRLTKLLPFPLRNVRMDLDIAAYPPPPRPSRNGYYINPERPGHPLFSGISRRNLRVWSDYTGWDESKAGFPAIYPVTDGFVLDNKSDVEHVAVLANYGPALESLALAELFDGPGSILVCGFDLTRRTGLDPIADRLLLNVLEYMGKSADHARYPLITSPIVWGDYATEKGVLTGINSGLLLNPTPKRTGSYRTRTFVVTAEGHQFAGGPGGWNTRPGLQYVPYGRRPFGPYYLRGFGNIPEPLDPENPIGEGTFWCSVPAGKTRAVTLVWNPADEPLEIRMQINDHKEAVERIPAGEKRYVEYPMDSLRSLNLKVAFRGDRRLVLLQTSFE